MSIHCIRIFQRSILVFFLFLSSAAFPGIPKEIRGSFSPQAELSRSPRIKLQWRELDVKNPGELRAQGIPDAMAGPSVLSPTGREYLIVQFNGPITDEQRNGLAAGGARIHEYIPDFAFLIGIETNRKASLRTIPGYLGSIPYLAKFKCSSSLSKKVMAGEPEGKDGSQILLGSGTEPRDLRIIGFKGEDAKNLINALVSLGAAVQEFSEGPEKIKIQAVVPTGALETVAALPAVRWIEPVPEWKLWNNLAAEASECNVRDVWNTHGLYGSGQIAAVADTGLDKGSILPANLHLDFQNGAGGSRVITIFDIAGDGDPSDKFSGHGTHVAGSVLGNGAQSGSVPGSHSYPSSCFAGMAPEAQLVFQACENASGGLVLPSDLNTLFNQARTSGAWVHSNSWGSADAGQYTSDSQDVDENIWTNKNFSILFAAGNEGVDANRDGMIDPYSVSSPSTAKNCITVGASENYRPSGGGYNFAWGAGWPQDYYVNPIYSDHVSNNVNGMAAFSSRGPCMDGRRKPDITTPGTNIISVHSSVGGTLWGAYNTYYSYSGGTSMATPLAAGSSVLVRDFFAKGNYPGISTPSSALVKAVLAAGATDMTPGQYVSPMEIPVRPNGIEGFGRINVEDSLFTSGLLKQLFFDNTSGLSTGGEVNYYITVTGSTKPLHVVLAWSDYPGSLSYGGGLVNDLDLNVIKPDSTVVYPNNASQRGPSRYLSFSDGNITYATGLSAGQGLAVKFTPPAYPYTLDGARFLVYNSTTTYSRYPWTVNVWDDDGSAGRPGTLLGTTTGYAILLGSGIGTISMPLSPVTISSGSFYIEFRAVSGSPALISTTVAPNTNGNDFYYNGSTWSGWNFDNSQDLDIDAMGHLTDYTTSNDRVNNVEGIDIATPVPGTYRIRIQGYNVAQGPQPYGLAITGEVLNGSVSTVSGLVAYNTNGVTGYPLNSVTVELHQGSTVETHNVPLTGTSSPKSYSFTTTLTGTCDVVIPQNSQTGWYGDNSNTSVLLAPATTVNFNLTHALPGDADMDGMVYDSDVDILNGCYGITDGTAVWSIGDFDGDGKVYDSDVDILNGCYGITD